MKNRRLVDLYLLATEQFHVKPKRSVHAIAFSIKDTKEMSPIEVKAVYDRCVKWVQDPRNRAYGVRIFAHDVFT
jgi:hypothetical protein